MPHKRALRVRLAAPRAPCAPPALQSLNLSDSVAQFSHTMTAQVSGPSCWSRVGSEREGHWHHPSIVPQHGESGLVA